MRGLLWLGAIVGVLALLGRRGRPGRTDLERELQEAASAGVTSFGAVIDDALTGAGVIFDEARSVTGASVWQGGGKGAAVLQPRASYVGLPASMLGTAEPQATAILQ